MIKLEHIGRTLFATFSNPATLNALDASMAAELDKLTSLLRSDRELGLVVLQGEGRAFMAGGDINAFRGDDTVVQATVGSTLSSLNAFVEALASTPCLILASVHGAVAGGGLAIMLACDLVLASDETRFVFAYATLGATPDGGLTHNLPAIVGRQRALGLLLASGPIGAEDALRLGLVNEIVPDAEREARTQALAERLVANSHLANAETKTLVRAAAKTSLREQLSAEKRAFLACAGGHDFKEGVAAFFEKRAPVFARARAAPLRANS